MLRALKYTFLILVAAALLVGCSGDDDDNGTGPVTQTPPTAPNTTIEVPASIASLPAGNYGRQLVESQIQAMTGLFSAYTGFLTPPSGAVASKIASPQTTWTWSDTWYGTSIVVTMTYTDDGPTRKWTVTVGSFYVVTAEEWKDDSRMEFRYYTLDGYAADQPELVYVWYVDGDDYFHFDVAAYNNSGATPVIYYDYSILVRADGTGYFEIYSDDNLLYEITWSGTTGSWIFYNPDGSIQSQGSW
ncbi:hypothetical protein GF377_11190 [candidate division GN15 bacterium]|nr:hypothetical protein [candidate division GN15 bacterium]